jgi:hypothetical protein
MVEASQAELDAKIIDCQTFKEANRGTMDQITTDLARLAEQIADTERIKLEANNGISRTNQAIKKAKEDIATERSKYLADKAIDDADMRVKQNDLEVFQFILEFTKCQEESLLQLQHGKRHSRINVCERKEELVLNFGDKAAQKRYERMMTPDARKEIQKILTLIRADEAQRRSLVSW